LTEEKLFNAIIKCSTPKEAEQLIDEYVAGSEYKEGLKKLVKRNLAYFAGYYAPDKVKKFTELVNEPHPYFGFPNKDGTYNVTPREALQIGVELGRKMLKNKEKAN